MRRIFLALVLAGCVQGPPMAPEDIPPQQTKWGRSDSTSITVVIPNPFFPRDTTGGP